MVVASQDAFVGELADVFVEDSSKAHFSAAASNSETVTISYPLLLISGTTLANIGGVQDRRSWQMITAPGLSMLRMCHPLTLGYEMNGS